MWSSPEEAVRQALLRYCRGVDRLDAELIRAAFWPDARVTLGAIYDGAPDGFVEVAMGFMGMFAATRHDVANMVLAMRPDGIGYEAHVRTWHRIEPASDGATEGATRELEVLGRYIGRATERDGEWRLAEHGELMDWGVERAVDAGWFDGNAELDKGRRDRADGSYRFVG